ncbi:MAG TPA: magnesium transporter [Thermoanaerobaculia bacterium]
MSVQTVFASLLLLQFVVVVSHDWIDIPGWTHGSQVQAVIGRRKLWLATLINAVFPGAAAGLAIYWWSRPRPLLVVDYWVVYCAITVLSAIAMWYVPYFFGADDQHKRLYAQMYEGTRQVLPPRGNNPRPNLLHLCFHVLFVVNLFLVVLLRFGHS